MKRNLPTWIVFLTAINAFAGPIMNGGRGMIHVKSAMGTRPKQLWATWQSRAWGEAADVQYFSDGVVTRTTFWDVQGVMALNYGVLPHLSLAMSTVIYQDVNTEGPDDLFGDTSLDIRTGNYQIQNTNAYVGLNLGLRFPTGSYHNILFEEYTAGTTEAGLTGLFTYRYKLPNLAYDYRIHVNLTYWNYFDKGARLVAGDEYREISVVKKNSQAFYYGFGLEFPTTLFDYGLEFYGLSWITFPPPAAGGRENFLYMNMSFGYKPHPRFKFYTALDLRLSKDVEYTQGPRRTFSQLDNYPGWRVYLGVRAMILPKSLYDMYRQALIEAQSLRTRSSTKKTTQQAPAPKTQSKPSGETAPQQPKKE